MSGIDSWYSDYLSSALTQPWRKLPAALIEENSITYIRPASTFDYSFDVIPAMNNLGKEDFLVSNDKLPIGTIPIFATSSPEYQASVTKMVHCANDVFADFLKSDEGLGFCGSVCMIGDSMGAILAYDALCRDIIRSSSEGSVNEVLENCSNRNRSLSGNNGESIPSSPKIITSDSEGNKVSCYYVTRLSSFLEHWITPNRIHVGRMPSAYSHVSQADIFHAFCKKKLT